MNKALFVIDMQNVCVGKNHANLFKYDCQTLIHNVNDTIAQYPMENVYYILNIMKNNLINKLAPVKAYDGTYEIQLVDDLLVVNNQLFKKYTGDAFTNQDLVSHLKKSGITEIELVGLDGGGCIAKTALGALDAGYKVTLNTHAIGTMFEKKARKYNQQLKSRNAVFIED